MKGDRKEKMFHKSLQILKNPVILKSYNKVCGVTNADRIHDYLYLGNVESSKDEVFLKKHQIYAILNCTEEEPFARYFDFKPKLRIPVKDSRDDANKEGFYQYLCQAVSFIDQHVEKKDVVLVHCYWFTVDGGLFVWPMVRVEQCLFNGDW